MHPEGGIARPRAGPGELIVDADCAACPWIQTAPRTFRWTVEARRIFEAWRFWKRTGYADPDLGVEEWIAFEELEKLVKGLATISAVQEHGRSGRHSDQAGDQPHGS